MAFDPSAFDSTAFDTASPCEIDFKAICDALAACYAPGTIARPTGAVAMRKSYGQIPKNVPAVPAVIVVPQQGTVTANPGQWKHEMALDAVFILAKRPGDPARVEAQRQIWLPTLLGATQGQLKLGLGSECGYSVDKAIPNGWDFVEFPVGGDTYDGIVIHYTVYVTQTVTLVP